MKEVEQVLGPGGAIEAFAYLLDYCGQHKMASNLLAAIQACIANGEKTGDLGGKLNTMEFTKAVIGRAMA